MTEAHDIDGVRRGRLDPPSSAPERGETTTELGRLGEVMVEQITSGRLAEPTDFAQAPAEWVLVIDGRATLEVAGEPMELRGDDWVVLPSLVPHRLVDVDPGTRWLAVHVPARRAPTPPLIVRPERDGDQAGIRAVHAAAFGPLAPGGDTAVEVGLVDALRASPAWIPGLSLVAVRPDGDTDGGTASGTGTIVGHVVCTRAHVDGAVVDTEPGHELGAAVSATRTEPSGPLPVLGLGPLGVLPEHQGAGVGSALVRAVLGAAGALGEPLVALLGDPTYYGRFGFRPASELGIDAPGLAWGRHFQALGLNAGPAPGPGRFHYAAPFDDL